MVEQEIFESIKELQILGIGISGFLLIKTIIDFKRSKISKASFYIWLTVWSVALITFFIPRLTQSVFLALSAENAVLIGLAFAVVVLFIMVYVLNQQIFASNKQLKKLIQRLAMDEKETDLDKSKDLKRNKSQ